MVEVTLRDIIVLDFNRSEVIHYKNVNLENYSKDDLSEDEDDLVWHFLDTKGHRLKDCEYMFSESLEVTEIDEDENPIVCNNCSCAACECNSQDWVQLDSTGEVEKRIN